LAKKYSNTDIVQKQTPQYFIYIKKFNVIANSFSNQDTYKYTDSKIFKIYILT